MYPFTAAEMKSPSLDVGGSSRESRSLRSSPPRGTCLAGYRTGTELQVVMAGAWIAGYGSAHGERRVSGVRRAAPLWWFRPDERVSAPSIERCQLQRASRAASERQKFPSQEIFEARSPCALPETAIHAPATATLQVRPRLLGIDECPHYRRRSLNSSSSSVRICRTICWLWLTSTRASSPASLLRAPPMVNPCSYSNERIWRMM